MRKFLYIGELDMFETNSVCTNIEEIRKELLDDEYEEFIKCITEIPFISYLISPDRKRVADCEKDEDGRVIVDLTHPHILENMSYFTEARNNMKRLGRYCPYEKSISKTSQYGLWWKREVDRCRNGMTREDGEWIPGIFYFYLNYNPILKTKIIKKKNKEYGVKVEDFPDMWATSYYRFHYLIQSRYSGHHAIELAARGKSKSYTLASILAHNLLFGEDEEAKRRITTILLGSSKEFLSDKDGTFSKFRPIISWCAKHTEFPHLMLKNSTSDMTWISGYLDKNKKESGSLNTVIGLSASDDIGKIRGKRGWVLIEEMGEFEDLVDMYNTIRPGVEDGGVTTAMCYMVGTSTPKKTHFEGAKTLLCSTDKVNINPIPNVFEPTSSRRLDKFGFFVPCYLNRLKCYDGDGNSDVTKALAECIKVRLDALKTGNPKNYLYKLTEFPITPSDAMLNAEDSFFPTTLLMGRLLELDSKPFAYDDIYCGSLYEDEMGNVVFTNGGIPIREYPLGNQKKEGCVEIYEMPKVDANNEVFSNRYIIGHDPVDNDKSTSDSLSSTIVFDTFTDSIVAEYTGRHSHADDNYHICLLLCKYYNAKCLYESNKKGMYAYFSKMLALKYLADTPKYLREREIVKYEAYGSNMKGVNAIDKVNEYADDRTLSWLTTPVDVGGEQPVLRLNLLRNRALIQEMIAYGPGINTDRVRALGMVMLLREEYIIKTKRKTAASASNPNYMGNDKFFQQNSRGRWK